MWDNITPDKKIQNDIPNKTIDILPFPNQIILKIFHIKNMSINQNIPLIYLM